jgi:hypothetical protein
MSIPVVPTALLGDPLLAPFGHLLEISGWIFTAELALIRIEARRLGAVVAGDGEAAQRQKAAYGELQEEMRAKLLLVSKAIEKVLQSLEWTRALSAEDIKRLRTELSINGLSPELTSLMRASRVDESTILALDTIVRDPELGATRVDLPVAVSMQNRLFLRYCDLARSAS